MPAHVRPTSYEEIPYVARPYPQTHPDRLATVATLLGLKPQAISHCRVLELGCGNGGNLIPMALTLPESRFIGFDLAGGSIAEGRALIEQLGLKNIVLERRDILDVPDDLGPFDYILAHGVYSWVPQPVRVKLLSICARNLAAQGVAYVSYNTYPGWHLRTAVREMMLYRGRHSADPRIRIREARALLEFLAQAVPEQDAAYRPLLLSSLEALRGQSDSWFFHDILEEVNEPFYFHEFIAAAAAHGLRYLGEADVTVMLPGKFKPEVETTIRQWGRDIIEIEQYMDFVRNRLFRQTLLCHAGIVPNYEPGPERVLNLYAASPACPVSAQPDLLSDKVEQFQGREETMLSSGEPLIKAALVYLWKIWPRAVSLDKLLGAARAHVGSPPLEKGGPGGVTADRERLSRFLLDFYFAFANRLVELRVQPPPVPAELGDRPVASLLARLQARAGGEVTNLRHESIRVSSFDRRILEHLDGKRDRAALLQLAGAWLAEGRLAIQDDKRRVEDAAQARRLLEQHLDQQLQELARNALLVG